MQAIRLPEDTSWKLNEIMVRERDAYGFYFAAHPITQFGAVTSSHGAMSYAALCGEGPIAEGHRKPAVMAALIEKIRWRESKRGNRFVLADLSDNGGQFSASCFEQDQCEMLAKLAEDGGCALLNVELDQRSDDESPRVAIRRVQPLDGLEKTTRTRLELDVLDADGMHELANLMAPLSKGKSELIASVPSLEGKTDRLFLGNSFQLDAEIVETLNKVPGLSNIRLGPAGPLGGLRTSKPNLRLVS
jgi:DNA polymerase-3 subunit alpha